MSYTHDVHFLRNWQRSLAALPEGTGVFVVSGCSDRPKETEAVFLDYAAATIWIATRPDPINYKIDGFTLVRQKQSDLSLLRPGAPPINEMERVIRKRRPELSPLPSDREFKEPQ